MAEFKWGEMLPSAANSIISFLGMQSADRAADAAQADFRASANYSRAVGDRMLATGDQSAQLLEQLYADYYNRTGGAGTLDPSAIYKIANDYYNATSDIRRRRANDAFGSIEAAIPAGMENSTLRTDMTRAMQQAVSDQDIADLFAAQDRALAMVKGQSDLRARDIAELGTVISAPYALRTGNVAPVLGAAANASKVAGSIFETANEQAGSAATAFGGKIQDMMNNFFALKAQTDAEPPKNVVPTSATPTTQPYKPFYPNTMST